MISVNGALFHVDSSNANGETTLLQYLRNTCRATSVKHGCGEGGCGACVVVQHWYDGPVLRHRSINTCLTPVVSAIGTAITTVEGLHSETVKADGETVALHAIQEAFVKHHALQCGFCTPGFIMSLYATYLTTDGFAEGFLSGAVSCWTEARLDDIEEAWDGNLCRCTGYRPILEAAKSLVPTNAKEAAAMMSSAQRELARIESQLRPLMQDGGHSEEFVNVKFAQFDEPCYWSFPTSLASLFNLMHRSKLINMPFSLCCGHSERHIVRYFRRNTKYPQHLINTGRVNELKVLRLTNAKLVIGAGVPVQDIVAFCKLQLRTRATLSVNAQRILRMFVTLYRYFAGQSVRNVACLGGNAVTASPISDSNPMHISLGAIAQLQKPSRNYLDKAGGLWSPLPMFGRRLTWSGPGTPDTDSVAMFGTTRRSVQFGRQFFLGYRRTCLSADELLVSIEIPIPPPGLKFSCFAFKGCRRLEDDISIVNASFAVTLKQVVLTADTESDNKGNNNDSDSTQKCAPGDVSDPSRKRKLEANEARDSWEVARFGAAFGGMAPTPLEASDIARWWTYCQRKWNFPTLLHSLEAVVQQCRLPRDAPGGLVEYREHLCLVFYTRFYFQTCFEQHFPWWNGIDEDTLLHISRMHEVSSISPAIKPVLHMRPPMPRSTLIDKWLRVYFDPRAITASAATMPYYTPTAHSTFNYQHARRNSCQQPCLRTFSTSLPPALRGGVGQAVPHLAARLHVTGEAVYTDDTSPATTELHAFPVISSRARAVISSIDATEARKIPGFVDLVVAADVPGSNHIGAIFYDEELLAAKEVFSTGQTIALVLATSHEAARDAGSKLQIGYAPSTEKAVLTMEEGIAKRQFMYCDIMKTKEYLAITTSEAADSKQERYVKSLGLERLPPGWQLTKDGVPIIVDVVQASKTRWKVLDATDEESEQRGGGGNRVLVLSGSVRIGGQEQFYLETNCVRVTPTEGGGLDVLGSTQDPAKSQALISTVTGLPRHKIVSRCKRLGGGFGGKETRAAVLAALCAVAAIKSRRPVRLILDRDVDMQWSGQRHPFLMFYRAIFEGCMWRSAELQLYCEAGWSSDLSVPVLERSLLHVDNAYKVPMTQVVGRAVRTNKPSNTAFRGFGGPQGMFLAESIIELASTIIKGISPERLRFANLYRKGDCTHYTIPISQDHLTKMWDQLQRSAQVEVRKQKVEQFNGVNWHMKRGLAQVPVKFGMSFTKAFMNQAGALVNVYADGSVVVNHCGVEMGQGLNTKMAQVAAFTLHIPIEMIEVAETSTHKVPNGMPTAASSGADLNGMAVKRACEELLQRLKPFLESTAKSNNVVLSHGCEFVDPDTNQRAAHAANFFSKACAAAHMNRVSLSATGFYATPGINYSFETGTGRPFHYFAHGVCAAEVELDCLVGRFRVLRCDILHDVGSSLNPALDIGQVEGAFLQGQGLFTIEELSFDDKLGTLTTRGPGGYKIPGVADIPEDFRVSLLEGAPNDATPAVYSSKGVGEPPLFLASAVFFALRRALMSRRADLVWATGISIRSAVFPFDAPATCDRLALTANLLLAEDEEEIAATSGVTTSSVHSPPSVMDLPTAG